MEHAKIRIGRGAWRIGRSSLRSVICSLLIAVCICFSCTHALADDGDEDLEMINRPVNLSGLTGLLFTTSPFTLPIGDVEVAFGALAENSTKPDYTISEVPNLSISVGIAQNMELALRGSYFRRTLQDETRIRGTGDTELSYKWTFLPQTEDSPYPAMALILTGIGPTSNKGMDLGGVTHWGGKAGLSIGREITWGEHVLGAYVDGLYAFNDLFDRRYQDRFGIADVGLIVPISKYRNLQTLVEYNYVKHKAISAVGGDYSGLTFGLRLVSVRFNMTIGTQFVRKQVEGFENTNKVMGMISIKL